MAFSVPAKLDFIGMQGFMHLLRNGKFAICATLGWVFLVRLLRYRRVNQKHRVYPYKRREDFKHMTNKDAFEIQRYLYDVEFPFTTEKALQFALFRTYGIPTISKTLVKSKQLAEKENASRRYADTVVLIAEFMSCEPDAPRTKQAISRMNYLHSIYQKSGQISNDDLLYTLGLFALEPGRWIQKYEWRELTPMERCAFGTFWKSLGDAMGISYAKLPSFAGGWTDGLAWLDEVEAWSEAYEARTMVPDMLNNKVANETTDILLWDVPDSMKPFGRRVVSALMDGRLRKAMIYEPPPAWLQRLVESGLQLRKYLIRYFFPPRPQFMAHNLISKEPDENGRLFRLEYESEPWYVKPTFAMRWGLQAWFKWLVGRPIAGDDGSKYQPEGYVIRDVGPKMFVGKGNDYFDATYEKLSKQNRGGCPFGKTAASLPN